MKDFLFLQRFMKCFIIIPKFNILSFNVFLIKIIFDILFLKRKSYYKVLLSNLVICNVQSPKNIHNSKHTFYFVNSFRLSYDIGHNFFWETVLSVELIHSKNGCVFKTKARDDITKTHDTSGK